MTSERGHEENGEVHQDETEHQREEQSQWFRTTAIAAQSSAMITTTIAISHGPISLMSVRHHAESLFDADHQLVNVCFT